jgi:RND family efflux transporter MFP subunit
VAVAVLGACRDAAPPPPPEVRPVRTIRVEPQSVSETVALTGNVQAQTEINQSFRIDGRMLERPLGVGDTVRPGQLIARLDPENEDTNVQSARAQLAAAQAQRAEAENNLRRMRDLVAERAVSRASFENAESLMKAAVAQVEAAQTRLNLAQNRLTYTRLVADVAGVVTAVGAEPGEVVGAGRMIVQVARDGGRDAVFDVPARVKDAARGGSAITVTLASDPTVSAAGTVREVAPRADPLTGTFRVRIALKQPPPAMRLGATVTGRIRATAGAPAIELPPSAVVRGGREPAVWIVDPKTQTVAQRAIKIRSSDPNRVEIASGLDPGDIVVTAGVQALRPGQKVSLLKAAP